jgi:uncharacterized protein YllA (UPF0747 family)
MMRISFGSLPSMSALFLDYVNAWERVRNFYPQDYSIQSVVSFARGRKPQDARHRETLATALATQQKHWGSELSGIDKLAAGAVAVITGQQAGLFTGPNYAVLKALTAIKLARALNDAGVSAVPVFWIAAEDHDFQEIEWAAVLDKNSAVHQVRVNLANDEGMPSGWLSLKDDVSGAVSNLMESLPDSEFRPALQDLLNHCYRPGVSPVDAFGRMLAKLFEGFGLVLVNPLDAGLRQLAQPTLHQIVRQNSQIRSAILSRNRALSEAGYHEQVRVDENFTGVFAYRNKSRQPVRPNELTTELALSANVLTRPVMQDSMFSTVAYIGGPAEIAYFAQAAAVYETLSRPVPPVYPRISATLLEPRVSRALKKYDMEFLDVCRGRDFMRHKAVATVQGVELFDRARDRIGAELESLRPALTSVDATLGGALDTSHQKMVYQIDTLRNKFVNAEARRNEILERQLEVIGNSLFPEKKLQERVLNIASFLGRYGLSIIPHLEQALDLDSRQHQVVDI